MALKILSEENPYDFTALADAVFAELKQKDDLAAEINFVTEEEIRKLNAETRGIDKVTDVLSFPYLDGIRYSVLDKGNYSDSVDEEGNLVIGSVCICLKRAEKQAQEYGHSLLREVTYLALHGLLHCFGYDHISQEDESEMTALAEKIMNEIKVTR